MARLSTSLPMDLNTDQRGYAIALQGAVTTQHATSAFANSHAVHSWLEQQHHNPRVRFETSDTSVKVVLKDDGAGEEKELLVINIG